MLIPLLKKLISFKTITRDTAASRVALSWVASQIKGLPLIQKNYSINGFPSLLITTRKTRTPRVLLAAHIDVVDGAPSLFRPRRVGDRLYGRGSFDMKFGIACSIALLRDLGAELARYDIGILLTSDEETGGEYGVGALVKRGIGADVCILPDGGKNWVFESGAKGIYAVRIDARGRSAHGSRPWLGTNAIDTLSDALAILRARVPREPCEDATHRHVTVNTGIIQGGTMRNVIPDSAYAIVDIRYPNASALKRIQRILGAISARLPGIAWSPLYTGEPCTVPVGHPLIRSFFDETRRERRKPISFLYSHGSSDARFLIPAGVPTILVRPNGDGHHSDREWISVRSLEQFYRVVKRYVQQIARLN